MSTCSPVAHSTAVFQTLRTLLFILLTALVPWFERASAQDMDLILPPGSSIDLPNTSGNRWYILGEPGGGTRIARVPSNLVGEFVWPSVGNFAPDTTAYVQNRIFQGEYLRIYAGTATLGTVRTFQYNTPNPLNTTYTITVRIEPAPAVLSLNILDPSPTVATYVRWRAVFDRPISNVTTANFGLINPNGIVGAYITSVTGSGTTWDVTAFTGTGTGLLYCKWNGHVSESPSVPVPFTGQTYDFSELPLITQDPASGVTIVGGSYTLTCLGTVRTGAGVLYQWFRGSSVTPQSATAISGATSSSYTVTNVQPSGGSYFCRVYSGSNTAQTRDSVTATVTGLYAPDIPSAPNDRIVPSGYPASITVSATGSQLHFQWYRGALNDTSQPVGTDSNTLNTGPLTENTSYWVRVYNALGSAYDRTTTAKVRVVTTIAGSGPAQYLAGTSAHTSPYFIALDSVGVPAVGVVLTVTVSPGAQGASALINGTSTLLNLVTDANGAITVPLVTNATPGAFNIVASYGAVAGAVTAINTALQVTTASDENDGNANPYVGTGASLREVLTFAQLLGGARQITFAPTLTGASVSLAIPGDSAFGDSALRIDGDITLQGPTSGQGVTLHAASASGNPLRHFLVNGSLKLRDLMIHGGSATTGGAILNRGTLSIERCTVYGNSSTGRGGALRSENSGTTSIVNSTFTSNTAGSNGGALSLGATTTLLNTTIAGNTAAASGAGLYVDHPSVTLINTIVAGDRVGSFPGSEISGTASLVNTSRNNLIGLGGTGGLVNGTNGNRTGATSLRLLPLGFYGGPTLTLAPLVDSPAVDAGSTPDVSLLATDQRGSGFIRAYTAVDIGAVESFGDDLDSDGLSDRWEYSNFGNLDRKGSGDFDGDSFSDGTEYINGTSPISAASVPAASYFARVYSAQPDGGLDLYGTFAYAVDFGRSGASAPPLQIGSAVFQSEDQAGVSILATGQLNNWYASELGSSAEDTSLETIYSSIRWAIGGDSNPALRTVRIQLADLVPGRRYKLQLLFGDVPGVNRVFDIALSTGLVVDNFQPATKQGPGIPVAFIHEFTADSTALQITLDGSTPPHPTGWNIDPIINGLTLEALPTPAAAPIISPAGGVVSSLETGPTPVSVTLAAPTPGSVIFYTLDGSTPSSSNGAIYTGPVMLWRTTTVRAVALGGGWQDSPVAEATYTIRTAIESWRASAGADPAGAQDLANPSGDGVPNLLKYAFNLAPGGNVLVPNARTLAPGGVSGLPRTDLGGTGRLQIEFIRRRSAADPGLAYFVETGPSLDSFSPLPGSALTVTPIDSVWERVVALDTTTGPTRFGRVRVEADASAFFNFDTGLQGAALRGNATWTGSSIQLTPDDFGQIGSVVFPTAAPASPPTRFVAEFLLTTGPSATGTPADGMSFSFGDLGTAAFGEDGPGLGHDITVGFDTYANSASNENNIGMRVRVNGVLVAFSEQNPYTNGRPVPVRIVYDAGDGITVFFNNEAIFTKIPTTGFTPSLTDRFGIGGRTGGLSELNRVDSVSLRWH